MSGCRGWSTGVVAVAVAGVRLGRAARRQELYLHVLCMAACVPCLVEVLFDLCWRVTENVGIFILT